MLEELCIDFGKALARQLLAYALCLAAFRKVPIYDRKKGTLIEQPPLSAQLDAADGIFCQPFFTLLAALAISATYEMGVENSSIAARWSQVTRTSYLFNINYTARMAWHSVLQFFTIDDGKLFMQMTAHHVLSAACFGYGLATGRMHFFGVLDGCCEVTTIFLNGHFVLSTYTAPDRCFIGKAVCGVGLWFTFIIFRLILFPTWLYVFVSDVRADPTATWDTVDNVERYGYPMVTLLLLGLSSYWFVGISKAVVGAAMGTSGGAHDRKHR
jgi:hypothetical protein